jgi:hypothetical protein
MFGHTHIDAPPNFLMDSTTSPNVKTTEGERIGVRSLARNTSGVEGHDGASGWD